MKKQRQIRTADPDTVEKVCRFLNCDPITATVLVNRNLVTETDLASYVDASFNVVRPPFDIKDMDVAVARLFKAIVEKERILVFGDYDVDGITATTAMVEFLESPRCFRGESIAPFHSPIRVRMIVLA